MCALLTVWIALSAANMQAASFSLLIYGLANLIVYTDALDFMLRLYVRRRNTATAPAPKRTATSPSISPPRCPPRRWRIVPVRPYAIIASIYNLEDRCSMSSWKPSSRYRDTVWLISDGSTDDTVMRLRQAGWRCFDDGVNRRKPGAHAPPARAAAAAHRDRDGRSIRTSASAAATTAARIDLERLIRDFQQSGAAAVCPRIMIEPDGFLARFQAFEYALAFRVGRESLADYSITSGVSFYRRDALARALASTRIRCMPRTSRTP